MTVVLFYAALILAGGLVAGAFVILPHAVLRWTVGGFLPGWLLVLIAYAASVAVLKLFNRAQPGFLFLTIFILVATTLYHVGHAWRVLDAVGRAVLVALAVALLFYLFGDIRRSGALWPLAVITRLAALLA